MKIYGYCNCAAFNVRAEGDEAWFSTKAARDEALAKKRAGAVARGLSESASRSGIYPIESDASAKAGVELFDIGEIVGC